MKYSLSSRLREAFILDSKQREILVPHIAALNRARLTAVVWIGPPVNVVHIALFIAGLTAGAEPARTWRIAIIAAHGLLLMATVGAWWVTRSSGKWVQRTVSLYYAALLGLGAAIAVADQLVTTAITPFIIVNVLAPLVLVIPPARAWVFHLVAFLLYVTGVGLVQQDPSTLLSTQVNGVTVLALGCLLSYVIWNGVKTRVLQQHQIDEKTRALAEAVRTKDRFFAIIAHDLRSPLTGFVGLTELLISDSDLPHQDRLNLVTTLHRSAAALHDLLENLLAWSRTEQGMIQYAPARVRMSDVLHSVLDGLMPAATRKGIAFRCECDPALTAYTDERMLSTVLRNLAANSVKFTRTGGTVTIRARAKAGGQLEVECVDNGIGIPEELGVQLFQLDRQAVRAGTAGESSSGLGLLLCRDHVRRMGGELHFESVPRIETRFWFTVPQHTE